MREMVPAGGRSSTDLRDLFHTVDALQLLTNEPLANHTRFGIGGPADLLAIAHDSKSFIRALTIARDSGSPYVVIGAGTNLIVSDSGFRGIVLKYSAATLAREEGERVSAGAGAILQDLVDFTVGAGLRGIETMTGIPGWVGAAVYGNAGAYGKSISESIHSVVFFDGGQTRVFNRAECAFHYRESIFKRCKDWVILGCSLQLEPADPALLRQTADGILSIRNQKYPPSMKCAGSIFKNFLFKQLPAVVQSAVPPNVVREGKVPSAWFLDQVGAKGIRIGDIQVADYHANLIYNDGAGSAHDLVEVIALLKRMVNKRFAIPLEEEVQYVGDFPERLHP